MHRAARIVGGVIVVIGGTVVGAVAAAYSAMWVAASFDRTESGWSWVFFVAMPIGLIVGATIGLYGSLWLLSRRTPRT